ncbi:type I-E CRISPR-associated protein Cas6/Cse3/CasE [Paraburkholderia sp. UCT31]|uniref:type I-E CRISPR-associated protein Cas6/Cse3/CasE n=1 Tax=Paraburkholderia sp. UCT31 TaxID=2615209 RepID=UPI001654E07B|nr:type I-E CRISPR-associated protein Cas6/Cse3/CasE [Paraburkholderia sp. UCT31]MBC8737217.1 type I-E CRISPR-associated protein Cas6/Cse3/CasE [Paraburkholderia sp. UCT31]
MHITQLRLAKSAEAASSIAQFLSSKYGEHQLLWELAGRSQSATRDFLYRADLTDAGLELLVLSKQPLNAVRAPWTAKVKPYQPDFREGQLLNFKLRAAVTVDKAQEGKRSQRKDLVMEKYREFEGRVPVQQVAQMAASQWLSARSENAGFRLVDSAASNYHCVTIREKEQPFKVPVLDMEGTLEVTNPESFLARHLAGFGKTRFAGMGLMLVRPVR